ncbi:hypothetical protein B0I37DRAFT_424150 [Chaetomium sp. MPI-CAGE-AT-0009]|nr:hypothetical protein B0I37DRAFT_424150 [Chaetomium sp. MPI-CAGE-AT-0009]
MATMQHAMASLNPQPPARLATLLTLPTEILIEISQHLCIHCHHPRIGEIPHDEAAIAIHGQTALANLTASSRHLRPITQPILFHFFHSLTGQIDTRRRLARFIHTLFHRPDLAASVRSLVLWTPNDELPHGQPAVAIKDEDGTLARAAQRLGPWWVGRDYASLSVLQELAIALAPEATYVLLQRNLGEEMERFPSRRWWTDWRHPMDKLRHVVLVGWRYRWPTDDYTYHIKEAREFLRHARNLESLVAVDCGGDGVHQCLIPRLDESMDLPWDVELPRLKKLSIGGDEVGPWEVEAIIRHSTVFEDLEFIQGTLGWLPHALDLQRYLGNAKKTLKRLCYSIFSNKAAFKESDVYDETFELRCLDEEWEFDKDWKSMYRFEVGLSLKDFSALETLELDQAVLYGPVFDELVDAANPSSCALVTTEEFLSKFPPSLMRLRMGCIFHWPIVFRDMLAMAEDRARFPKLRSVTLESEIASRGVCFQQDPGFLSAFPSRCLTLEHPLARIIPT